MTFKKIIKPAVLSCFIPLILTAQLANAVDNDNKPTHYLDYNFATIKLGLDQATNLGQNFNTMNQVDATYVGGLEVGRRFMKRFAVSIEYSHTGKSEASKTSGSESYAWAARSDALMANISADLMKESRIMPYAKLGIGASRNKTNNYVESLYSDQGTLTDQITYPGKTTNKFAWQIGAGLNASVNERFDVQMEYMFVNHGRAETSSGYYTLENGDALTPNNAQTTILKDHVVTIGLKIKF